MTRTCSVFRRAAAALAVAALAWASFVAPATAQVTGEWWVKSLALTKAWTVSKGAGVTVAVVDSGVVATLGDLKGRVLPGVDLSGGASGGSSTGQSDPGESCDGPGGCYSHGTDMALRIAGTGAGSGFTGVAPEAKILPVKITARSGQQPSDVAVAKGITWAVDHGAQIVDVSLNSAAGLCSAAEDTAGEYAYEHGVLIVSSAGNEAHALVSPPSGCWGAVAVGAFDTSFTPWAQTNYSPEVTFSAPGVDVPVETLSGAIRQHTNGTDGAAALVAGSFALIRAHFPTMGERDLVTRALWNVHNGHRKFAEQIDFKLGYGQVLPYYAMTYKLPALSGLANPVFDYWKKDLGPPKVTGAPQVTAPQGTGPSSGSATTSAGSATSSGAGPANGGITIHPKASDGDSGSSVGVIGGVVAAIVVVLLIGFVLVRRRGGSRTGSP